MTKVNYQLKGVDKLIKKISKLDKKAKDRVDDLTEGAIKDMVADAKSLAPYDDGFLRKTIGQVKLAPMSYMMFAFAEYAPYMEFGTGTLVNVPNELRDLAIQFKGKEIRQVNIAPQPFMYPAYVINRQYYIEDLKKMLKKLVNE